MFGAFGKVCSGKFFRTLSDWKYVRRMSVVTWFPRMHSRVQSRSFSLNFFFHAGWSAAFLNSEDSGAWMQAAGAAFSGGSEIIIWACSGKYFRRKVCSELSDHVRTMFGGFGMFGCNSIALEHVRTMFGKYFGHVRMNICTESRKLALCSETL